MNKFIAILIWVMTPYITCAPMIFLGPFIENITNVIAIIGLLMLWLTWCAFGFLLGAGAGLECWKKNE